MSNQKKKHVCLAAPTTTLLQEKTPVYLAGPMGGLPDDNKLAFNLMAKQLRKLGINVVNIKNAI